MIPGADFERLVPGVFYYEGMQDQKCAGIFFEEMTINEQI